MTIELEVRRDSSSLSIHAIFRNLTGVSAWYDTCIADSYDGAVERATADALEQLSQQLRAL